MNQTTRSSILEYAVIGSIAYMTADTIHECLGHGGMCLLSGFRITLLNAVYFRSNPANFITSMAGPISNGIAGFLLYFLLRTKRDLPFLSKWLLLNMMVYNLCWFSGTMLESIVSTNGDWSFAVQKLNLNSHIAHWGLLLVAVVCYITFFRMTRSCMQRQFKDCGLTRNQLVVYPYLFAVLTAAIAGLFFAGDRIGTSWGAILELVSSLPLMFISFKPNAVLETRRETLKYSYALGTLILFIAFCFTMGKGIYFA